MTGFIPAPIKPEITMDHLEKVDIRTGMVKRVELVRTSNKLVRLTVDFGDRRRTVLAGLRGERADPKAEIEGRQALFVVNLPARRIAGEISEAMLFDIGCADSLILPRCLRYRKSRCQMAPERDESCFRSGATRGHGVSAI